MPFALGNSHAKKLTAETVVIEGDLFVAGEIKQHFKEENRSPVDHTALKTTQTGTLEIGNHETRNTVKLHNFGPKISFSYNFRLQADSITTTSGSGLVKLHIGELASAIGLGVGDTIHVSSVSGTVHNGITAADMTGSFVLQSGGLANQMCINTSGSASQSSTIAFFTADISCVVYSSLDLHGDATTWVRETTVPGTIATPNGTRLNEPVPYPVVAA